MTGSGFLKGMAIGILAGAAADMAANSKALRSTGWGKTMHKASSAMDDMICDVKRVIR